MTRGTTEIRVVSVRVAFWKRERKGDGSDEKRVDGCTSEERRRSRTEFTVKESVRTG